MSYLRIAIRIFFVFAIIIFYSINPGCKDPSEFEPEVDSLVKPPGPIRLIYPPDDTGYVGTTAHPVQIDFIWNAIVDAEYYEFHLSSESTFNDSFNNIYILPFNTFSDTGFSTGDHFWRVRASSPRWTWFTDWSEVRRFRIWFSRPLPY